MTFPETTGGSGLNGNTALLLLLHEVCGGGTFVNLTDFVDFSRQLQNTFGGGGFARIYVGENANVSV
ncbi:hypothetical protein OLK001_02340 [Synechocystis sp. LKSZ1]